jgi:hypothetical protein
MLKRLRAMRSVAAATVMVIVGVLTASCLAAERMTPEQRACCEAMKHHCGEAALTTGCCGQTQDSQTLDASNRVEAPTHVLGFDAVAILDLPLAPVVAQHRALTAPSLLKPPGPPTFLLISSLRI